MMQIESDKNPKIKNIVKLLDKSRERKNQKKFIVEGRQENQFAINNGFKLLEIYIQPKIYQNEVVLPANIPQYEVSQNVYDKIAYRKITEGIVGIYEYPTKKLSELKQPKNPFILILEGVEKPGNLGAICRSADAFAVDAVILCDEKSDVYNPNVIRSSVGSVFTLPVISATKEEVYAYLQEHKISLFATYMNEKSVEIQTVDLSNGSALLFGTEHSGITEYWLDKAEKNVLIPMRGKIDSLNVSNAVAIASYEVLRQKLRA